MTGSTYVVCYPCLAGDHANCPVTFLLPDVGEEVACMCSSHDHDPPGEPETRVHRSGWKQGSCVVATPSDKVWSSGVRRADGLTPETLGRLTVQMPPEDATRSVRQLYPLVDPYRHDHDPPR